MSKEKKVVLSIVFGLVIISSILIVSAGIADWFKFGSDDGGEGELRDSKEVGVLITSTDPPEVVNIGLLSNDVLSEGTFTTTTFEFVVYSSAGNGNLPGTTSGDSVGGVNNRGVLINQDTATIQRGSNDGDSSLEGCWYVGSETYTGTTTCCGGVTTVPVKRYNCTVPLWYFDDAAPTNWKLNASLRDSLGQDSIQHVADVTDTLTALFSYNVSNDPSPTLNWSAVSLQLGINQVADNELTVNNRGNIDIASARITAINLHRSDSADTSKILSTWFKYNENTALTDACNSSATQLVNDTQVTTSLEIDYSLSTKATPSNSDLEFCLTDVITNAGNPVSTGAYKTPAGQTWTVEALQ